MKLGRFAFLMIVVMTAVFIGSAPPAVAAKAPPNYRPVDVGPRLRDMSLSDISLHLEGLSDEMALSVTEGGGKDLYAEGNTRLALWYDDTSGLWWTTYTVKAVGDHIEVWVADNLDFPPGDPRNPVVVTQEQIDYLVDEFDHNIFPTMESIFGSSDFHDGSHAALSPPDYYVSNDRQDRVIAMISNIGDENYYDPDYPIYIAGFYWGSTYEVLLDRNVISIDAYDWANRVGPDSSFWRDPDRPAKEFLYEGVFAHEYQHLLHDDYDWNEENWVNEGLSDLAEFLVGYGHPESHLRAAADYPENSLVSWGDQGGLEILADYGHAYLFQLYLLEQFGQDFIQAEFLNPYNGISGVNSTLESLQVRKRDFADVYHDYAVARLIDSKKPGKGRYAFENLDFHLNLGPPDAPNAEAFDTPGAPPWGTDYIWIDTDLKKLKKLRFDGMDETVRSTDWSSDGEVLWSGSGDLTDNWAIFEATGGGMLSFDTYYDIEGFWDFGFVQVSTDGGATWTSLENTRTTFGHPPDAHPTVVANLPGLTGQSGGWVDMSFSLSAYPGDILIAFRYVTDWFVSYGGWFIDNVRVDGALVSDGADALLFKDITQLVPVENDYTVTFVGMKLHHNKYKYEVVKLKLKDLTEEGKLKVKKKLKKSDYIVMLVTFDAPEGVTWYADYGYDYDKKKPKKPKKPKK